MSRSDQATAVAYPVLGWELPEGVDTPAVVVDVDALDRNITEMAAVAAAAGVGLRPHTKTSKCIEVIGRQVAAGARGLTVATLGEAEVLAAAGFDDLLIAYPLWAGHPDRARRLRAVLERVELTVGVESVAAAAALGEAAAGGARPLKVLIEIDPGLHRTGVEPERAAEIAHAAAGAGLVVHGAFSFSGQAYGACDAAVPASDAEVAALAAAREVLTAAGYRAAVLSAGCSPTARWSARAPVTEVRPGTYVFQDRQQVALGSAAPDAVALVVVATVVASHDDGRFVLDAGSKVLSQDRCAVVGGFGHVLGHPEAVVRSLSEHHAVVWSAGRRPRVGEVVAVVPNHCCVVVNLVDELVAVQRAQVVDRWPVASRGANR